jgi:hypothetical protein
MAQISQASRQHGFVVGLITVKNLEKVSWEHRRVGKIN